MWIFALGETLKWATLTSHAATSRLSGELCRTFSDMTKPQVSFRASLMHLLDVSTYLSTMPITYFNSFNCTLITQIFTFFPIAFNYRESK